MQKFKEIVRKQLVSVICGVVALVAVVLCFYPTSSWYTALNTSMDTSIIAIKQLGDLVSAQRNFPNLGKDPNAPLQPLNVWPTDDVIQRGTDAVNSLANQSQDQVKKMVDLNRHYQLVDGALPNGNELKREEFVKRYIPAVQNGYRIDHWPAADAVAQRPNLLKDIPPLKAGHNPTNEEQTQASNALKQQIYGQYLHMNPTNGQPTPESQAQAEQVITSLSVNMLPDMQKRVPQVAKVYIEPTAIHLPPVYNLFLTLTSGPNPTDIWTAQFNLWLTEDVATAIAYTNRNSKNVSESPIKQLLNLQMNTPPYLGPLTAVAAYSDTTPIPQNFDVSPTGRISNAMYDVLQFSLSMDVDATKVPQIIEDLQYRQLITVNGVQMDTVDSADRASKNFFYGSAPVVKLDLQCEELLMHDWLTDVEPPAAAASAVTAQASSPIIAMPFVSPSRFNRQQ